MNIENIDILTLIPQKRPFVMVDRLIDFNEEGSTTDFVVREDNLFCVDGTLLETGIMENIAQTCAARIGYINLYEKKESVKIGVIGSIKDFKIFELPKIGDILETTINVISEVFAITLVSAKVKIKDQYNADGSEKIIAQCEMKISLTDKEIG